VHHGDKMVIVSKKYTSLFIHKSPMPHPETTLHFGRGKYEVNVSHENEKYGIRVATKWQFIPYFSHEFYDAEDKLSVKINKILILTQYIF
jgi:hypothetical protein